jgi:hypothetical protein
MLDVPISVFCFLLSAFPKRCFGAFRPQAEPPPVQKLRSDPDKTIGYCSRGRSGLTLLLGLSEGSLDLGGCKWRRK